MRVSKETAVLLKEAGYDVATKGYYIGGDGVCWASKSPDNHNSNHMTYSAPTLHEAADWLRSKGVHICVFISVDRKTGKPFWYFELVDLKTFKYIREGTGSHTFETYEAAYEAGIVHGLKYVK